MMSGLAARAGIVAAALVTTTGDWPESLRGRGELKKHFYPIIEFLCVVDFFQKQERDILSLYILWYMLLSQLAPRECTKSYHQLAPHFLYQR
jgi:hypothetical protein